MEVETKESSSSTAVAEAPAYQPPANEPQGLESSSNGPKEPIVAGDKTAETAKESSETKPTVKLPASIKPPAKTGRFQERISDLVSQRDLHKREAEQLREQLSKQQSVPRSGETKAVPTTDGLKPEDFESYGQYVEAIVQQTLKQQTDAQKSQRAQQEYETHKQERTAQFNEHAAPLAEQYGEGFWDTIHDPSLPISEAMADAVMELDALGPFTMLYLAAHRDEAQKISRMNPRAATLAIGRLAAQLDYEIKGGGTNGAAEPVTTGTTTQTSQAAPIRPTPVPTPRGSSPSLNAAPSDKDSVDEWLRKETDRLRRINPNARFYGARLLAGLALLGALLAAPMLAEASCQVILIPDGHGGQRSCQVCVLPNGQTTTICS